MAALVITVDLTIYSLPALFRAMYRFTDDYFVFSTRTSAGPAEVHLLPKPGVAPPEDLVGSFANALVDEQLRCTIAEETRAVRELLIAEAFAATDLLDLSGTEADY